MGVTTVAWTTPAIHPLCHQRRGEMASNILYLQNNLTAVPWVHCILAGLNSNIYLVDAKGINRHLYICRKSIAYVKGWNACDQSLRFVIISLWRKVMKHNRGDQHHHRSQSKCSHTQQYHGLEVRTTDKVPSRGTSGFRKTLRRGYNCTPIEN